MLLLLGLLLLTAASAAADGPAGSNPTPGVVFDLQLVKLRGVIAAIAAVLLLWGYALERRRAGQLRGIRTGLLAILALTAFAANYNFFLWHHQDGFHKHDVFHYYVGAKYFPELGYFDLYRCSVAASRWGESEDWSRLPVRDLRTNELKTAAELAPTSPNCDGLFSAARWTEFRRDVRWFQSRLPDKKWRRVVVDQGFNPSPVWITLGRPLAEAVPAELGTLPWLVRVDLVLLLAMFAVVGWSFGLQAMCLAVIIWATNPLSRYQWVGDSFLRYPWLASSVIGIALLHRSRYAAAGSLLALSALLRLFPGFQFATYAIHQLRWVWRRRRLSRRSLRFAAGALGMTVVLLLCSLPVTQRGFEAYESFAQKITRLAQVIGVSSVGLRPLLSFSPSDTETLALPGHARASRRATQELQRDTFESRRGWYVAILLVFGVLLWRALGRCEPWEALALGVVPALLLPKMSSYYLANMVVMALLAVARPRIGIATLVALVAWCLSCANFYGDRMEYIVSSVIALSLLFYLLIELQFPARPTPRTPKTQLAPGRAA